MDSILTIAREKWKTGNRGKGRIELLNNEGFMCCLGFECIRRGYSPSSIIGLGEPNELNDEIELLSYCDDGEYFPTAFVKDAIEINDDTSISDEEREDNIVERFRREGIQVVFTGKYLF